LIGQEPPFVAYTFFPHPETNSPSRISQPMHSTRPDDREAPSLKARRQPNYELHFRSPTITPIERFGYNETSHIRQHPSVLQLHQQQQHRFNPSYDTGTFRTPPRRTDLHSLSLYGPRRFSAPSSHTAQLRLDLHQVPFAGEVGHCGPNFGPSSTQMILQAIFEHDE
jgi:hypothetical protein